MNEFVKVETTVDDKYRAEKLADTLLEVHLAACIHLIGPIQSHYWWKGKKETSREWLCVAKTTGTKVDDIVAKIKEHHTDENPEIVVTPIIGGSEDYLAWVDSEVANGSK